MDANTSYLQEHLAEEEKQDVRQERIQQFAKLLIEEGDIYYPFTTDNFTEALQNLPKEAYKELAETTSSVHSGEGACHVAGYVGHALALECRKYWYKIALLKAKRLVDNE